MDKMGLFFKLTSQKTLKAKGEKSTGVGYSKTNNATYRCKHDKYKKNLSHKKYKTAKMLQEYNMLPVQYEDNSKPWMILHNLNELFHEWMQNKG